MSWLQQLYKTYEYVSRRDDDIQSQDTHTLMPYYHVKQNIQVIVTISDKGDFVSAEICRDDNGKVKSHNLVVPATNDSATRSGQIPPPHPLSDKVQYLAGDYFEGYAANPKRDFHQPYLELLGNWCESQYAHPKAQAVLAYTQKGMLVKDLINAGVLIVDPNDASKLAYPEQASDYPDSLLSSLNKNKGVFDQGSAFIAWRVTPTDLSQQSSWGNIDTWRDESLFEAWQQFYATLDSVDGFCYITGQTAPLASKHPNRILRSATNAKLISANDLSGFTFLGRFNDNEKSIKASGLQGANISAVVTEKAHAALSWLLARQGKEEAGQAVVAWAISGDNILQPTQEIKEINTFSVVDNYQPTDFNDISDTDNKNFDTLFDIEEEGEFETLDDSEISSENHDPEHKLEHKNDLGFSFAKHLTNTLHGYRQRLDKHDQVSIIVLDSATPGRMAVTYYHESLPNDYIQAIEAWYRQFSWYSSYTDPETHERKLTISAPIPRKIAQVAYGSRLSDALKKQVVLQVLPCIVEGNARQLPWQLVDLCFKRACNPMALEHWEWEQSLSVACALYRGYYLRQSKNKQRSYTVALQTDYNSRDYLYGRLLAVAEDIESLALYIAGEDRSTTAQRYMQQFANRPFTTWRNIELALKPYENRLKNNRGGYLKNIHDLLDQIMNNFNVADFNDDSALSGEFLLGYHSQKMQLKLDKQLAKKARTEKEALTEASTTA